MENRSAIFVKFNPTAWQVLLCIYPRKMKTYVHRKACTRMCTPALFVIVKTCKQPMHSSKGEWINKS